MQPHPAIAARAITKSYGGEPALCGVDLDVQSGRVHALLGPNGSGKSTLIGILGGSTVPTSGDVIVAGEKVSGLTPATARSLGISVIHQHFSLASGLTVSDNVFLGSELRRGPLLDRAQQVRETARLISEFDLDIPPRAVVGDLTSGQRQVVEIVKALRHRPRVLILDEPTAALSTAETAFVLEKVRALAESGIAVIFISHLLDDVLAVANDVTVLRDGLVVSEGPIDNYSKSDLVQQIAPGQSAQEPPSKASGETILAIENRMVGEVGPITLDLHDGEVLGLFGLMGSGTTQFLEGLYGVGSTSPFLWSNRPVQPCSPREARDLGIGLVASDRPEKGVFFELSALDNLLMPFIDRVGWRFGIRRRRREREIFDATCTPMKLKPHSPNLPARGFSGGNQQKLLIGRWMNPESNTRLLLLDEPTQGVDVGARADIYGLIRDFVSRPGHAVVLASTEVEELEAVAHRVMVFSKGRIAGVVERGPEFARQLLSLAHSDSSREDER